MKMDARLMERMVELTAEAALYEQGYVAPIDILRGMGWLSRLVIDQWRRGQLASLETGMQVSPTKLLAAMDLLRQWVARRGLVPSEITYVSRNRGRKSLRFTVSGDEEVERSYRTHWVSPELSARQRERLAERHSRPPDLLAIRPINLWKCFLCGGTGDFLLMEDRRPVCLSCADLDHLVFLPSGDATLSRRARKASRLAMVVVRFAKARHRYERQGILVEEEALQRAEAECLADKEARARRRLRAAALREVEDVEFKAQFAEAIRAAFPRCPPERADAIARHAATRGSGRVGRSAAGRALDADAIRLAVVASVRHEDTHYDELLMSGMDRADAREEVSVAVDAVLDSWA